MQVVNVAGVNTGSLDLFLSGFESSLVASESGVRFARKPALSGAVPSNAPESGSVDSVILAISRGADTRFDSPFTGNLENEQEAERQIRTSPGSKTPFVAFRGNAGAASGASPAFVTRNDVRAKKQQSLCSSDENTQQTPTKPRVGDLDLANLAGQRSAPLSARGAFTWYQLRKQMPILHLPAKRRADTSVVQLSFTVPLGSRVGAVMACIENSSALEYLTLSQTGLQDCAMERLLEPLHRCPNLRRLDLSSNRLGKQSAIACADLLCKMPITSVKLRRAFESSRANLFARRLAAAEAKSLNLCELDIGENGLSSSGIAHLCDYLCGTRKLENLWVDWSEIGSSSPVAAALMRNISLHHLDLSFGGLDAMSTEAIASALEEHPNLTSLALAGNMIPRGSLERVAAAMVSARSGRSNSTCALFVDGPDVQISSSLLTIHPAAKRPFLCLQTH